MTQCLRDRGQAESAGPNTSCLRLGIHHNPAVQMNGWHTMNMRTTYFGHLRWQIVETVSVSMLGFQNYTFKKVPQLLEFYNLHFWACWHICPVLHKVALHVLFYKLLPTTKEKTSKRRPVVLIIIHKWNQQMFDSFCIRFMYLLQCGLKKLQCVQFFMR